MENYFIRVFSFLLLIMTFYGAAMNNEEETSFKELIALANEEYGPSCGGLHRFEKEELDRFEEDRLHRFEGKNKKKKKDR